MLDEDIDWIGKKFTFYHRLYPDLSCCFYCQLYHEIYLMMWWQEITIPRGTIDTNYWAFFHPHLFISVALLMDFSRPEVVNWTAFYWLDKWWQVDHREVILSTSFYHFVLLSSFPVSLESCGQISLIPRAHDLLSFCSQLAGSKACDCRGKHLRDCKQWSGWKKLFACLLWLNYAQ